MQKRFAHLPSCSVGMEVEEFEILAVVEDFELRFVAARSKEVGAQPRPSANHLPELGRTPHELEKDEVHNAHRIHARVHHINGNGDLRINLLVRFFELVQEVLRLAFVVVNDPQKGPTVLRVILVEPLLNEKSVLVVLGEDDGLSNAVPSCHLDAIGHEVFEHLVDGVGVEEPFVEGTASDFLRGFLGGGVAKLLFVLLLFTF